MPQVTWADLKDSIAQREREAELFSTPSENEEFNPYWDPADVELLLYEISCQLLREIPPEELEAIGSTAITVATYSNGAVLPSNTVKVLGAAIQRNVGDSLWVPAVPVDPAMYYQMADVTSDDAAFYSFVSGTVVFSGNAIGLTLLTEPTLANFQADLPILPPAGYDEIRVDWVHKALMTEDFIPGGRL